MKFLRRLLNRNKTKESTSESTEQGKSDPEQGQQQDQQDQQQQQEQDQGEGVGISNKLALGAGCYWGTEKYIRKDFQKKFPQSVTVATVGFMSPDEKPRIVNPTYGQVCTGTSGHVEVLYVELSNPEKHFEELIRFFYQFHDPTTNNRQGNDVGFQYASYIFCNDEKQQMIARQVTEELQMILTEKTNATIVQAYENDTITTLIGPLREFTKAEDEHQRYLEKNPNGYCNHRIRFKKWPPKK